MQIVLRMNELSEHNVAFSNWKGSSLFHLSVRDFVR